MNKKANALMITLLAISIVSIIILALTTRVIKNMRQTGEKERNEMAQTYASGALNGLSAKIQTGDFVCEEGEWCNITKVYGGIGDGCSGEMMWQGKTEFSLYSLKKDSVLEVNVEGFTGDINITITGTPTLVISAIGNPLGEYEVLGETLFEASGSYSVTAVTDLLRIKALKADTQITVKSASATTPLPVQMNVYIADVTCANVNTRNVRTEYLNAGVPSIFDFVIYNGKDNLVK